MPTLSPDRESRFTSRAVTMQVPAAPVPGCCSIDRLLPARLCWVLLLPHPPHVRIQQRSAGICNERPLIMVPLARVKTGICRPLLLQCSARRDPAGWLIAPIIISAPRARPRGERARCAGSPAKKAPTIAAGVSPRSVSLSAAPGCARRIVASPGRRPPCPCPAPCAAAPGPGGSSCSASRAAVQPGCRSVRAGTSWLHRAPLLSMPQGIKNSSRCQKKCAPCGGKSQV